MKRYHNLKSAGIFVFLSGVFSAFFNIHSIADWYEEVPHSLQSTTVLGYIDQYLDFANQSPLKYQPVLKNTFQELAYLQADFFDRRNPPTQKPVNQSIQAISKMAPSIQQHNRRLPIRKKSLEISHSVSTRKPRLPSQKHRVLNSQENTLVLIQRNCNIKPTQSPFLTQSIASYMNQSIYIKTNFAPSSDACNDSSPWSIQRSKPQARKSPQKIALNKKELEVGLIKNKAPKKVPNKPAPPRKILLIGDSLMGGISPAISKRFRNAYPKVDVVSSWKISSGLAVQKYYHWPKKIEELTRYNNYDLAVVLFGANDNKPLKTNKGWIRFRDKNWHQFYQNRVLEVVNLLCRKSNSVLWLEVPKVRGNELDSAILKINRVYENALAKNHCGEFLRTSNLIGSDQKYSSYAKVNNRLVKVRANDGIHINTMGGRLIAEKILNFTKSASSPREAH